MATTVAIKNTVTEYVVLKRTRAVHKAAEAASSTPSYEAWDVVDTVKASSAEAAIRKTKTPTDTTPGTLVLVAVPARSWKPVRVVTETVTRVKLEEA